MKSPMNQANLPAHTPLQMTQAQRDALPEIEWVGYTAPEHKHLKSTNAMGSWYIGHPRDTVIGPDAVELAYQLPLEKGESYDTLMKDNTDAYFDSHEGRKTWAKLSKQEMGHVFNQDYAKIFVEKAIHQAPGQDPEKILLDAGFKLTTMTIPAPKGLKGVKLFEKQDDKRGLFMISLRDHSLTLTHQKRNGRFWENLLSVYTQVNNTIPIFISPQVDNIVAAAAEMASYFVEHWKPTNMRVKKFKP